jgi:hypothetical protein
MSDVSSLPAKQTSGLKRLVPTMQVGEWITLGVGYGYGAGDRSNVNGTRSAVRPHPHRRQARMRSATLARAVARPLPPLPAPAEGAQRDPPITREADGSRVTTGPKSAEGRDLESDPLRQSSRARQYRRNQIRRASSIVRGAPVPAGLSFAWPMSPYLFPQWRG